MLKTELPAQLQPQETEQILSCRGSWSLGYLEAIEPDCQQKAAKMAITTIDGSALTALDTAGAWLLLQWLRNHQLDPTKVQWRGFHPEQQSLIDLLLQQDLAEATVALPKSPHLLYRLGEKTIATWWHSQAFLAFIGELFMTLLYLCRHPSRIRWRATALIIETSGFDALPIIALLSFLVGVVLTYQMGLQLRTYGANIFIVNLLGLAVLREFAPLMTAIIVAGRSGAAFAAQLGTMQIREELAALRTIGIPPAELLIVPKIIGLVIALPLLTLWADLFGMIGGMVMSKSMLDIGFYNFLEQFQQSVPVNHYLIGIGKTPVFAILIACIGCFQGLQVSGSADSVGRQTTRSVVQAIFFIIIADAMFSILLSWLKI